MNGVRDADILFAYDAKLANPNGDPDEENRPRIDEVTRRSLVTDVRLKRYLRDYWLDNGQDVWVRKLSGGRTVSANQRLRGLAEECKDETGRKVNLKKVDDEFVEWLLGRLIDIRLFGATMPIAAGEEGGRGGMASFTGPVQFSWGYSLHPVELVLSSGITSVFAGREREEKGRYGTMGKDWRLHYAFIAFYGLVSKARAKWTHLKPEDLDVLDTALIHAIPHQATSRSKLGQVPRLYLNVRYRDASPMLGDLRDHIELKSDKEPDRLRNITDFTLSLKSLYNILYQERDHIEQVRFWSHRDLVMEGAEDFEELPGFFRL